MIIENYARKIFVRQINDNDCGIACLKMILNYTGKTGPANPVFYPAAELQTDLSLLELKKLSQACGMSSKCVLLDIEFLRENKVPCVLHLTKDNDRFHYVLCMQAYDRNGITEYLIADPATTVYCLSEAELQSKWVTGAALYFEDLPKQPYPRLGTSWQKLFSSEFMPPIVWFAIPILSVLIALFGITISWILQKGMDNTLTNQKLSVITSVVVLLFIITFCKGLLLYLKQRLFILLGRSINKKLFSSLFQHFNAMNACSRTFNENYLKHLLSDLQKIQSALQAIVSVILSDGALLMVLLTLTVVYLPMSALLEVPFFMILGLFTIRKTFKLNIEYGSLSIFAANAEQAIIKSKFDFHEDLSGETLSKYGVEQYERYVECSQKLNIKTSNHILLYDSLSALTVMAVFAYGLIAVRNGLIAYTSFILVVLSAYFCTILYSRICNSIFTIIEGGDALMWFTRKEIDK